MSKETKDNIASVDKPKDETVTSGGSKSVVDEAEKTLAQYRATLKEIEAVTTTIEQATENKSVGGKIQQLKQEYESKKAALQSKSTGEKEEVAKVASNPEEMQTVEEDTSTSVNEGSEQDPKGQDEESTKENVENKPDEKTSIRFGRRTMELGVSIAERVGEETSSTKEKVVQRYQDSKQGMLPSLRGNAQNAVSSLASVFKISETQQEKPTQRPKSKKEKSADEKEEVPELG